MSSLNLAYTYNPDVLNCLANLSSDEVFTPPEIANQMLDLLPDELWHDPEATFLDPATKTGVFLREIAKRLLVGLEDQIPDLQERIDHIFHKQLFGIAITELTSLMARRSLYCSKYPNGPYSVSAFPDANGNIFYRETHHRWVNGRCAFCGASQEIYDRSPGLETHAYAFIHTMRPEEIFNMKFDVIIGNPPYQLSDGGAGASARPIYHLFIAQAKKLNPRYMIMITPSRWFAGGKGLDEFRDVMIHDNHIRKIVDFANAKDCFPDSSIGGGVNYFLWDRDYFGDCEITNINENKKSVMIRPLDEFPVFVRTNAAISIIHKVQKFSEETISEFVSSRNPYGIPSSARGEKNGNVDYLRLFSSQSVGFIKQKDVKQGLETIYKYKIMVSKLISEHAGEPDKNGMYKVISKTRLLKPGEICTDSYLIIFPSDDKSAVRNFYSYLTTKFTRFLILQAVSSINLSKEKFKFVPIQDFSKPWTDEELYAKYGLTAEEIAFIESMIRPMELDEEEKDE